MAALVGIAADLRAVLAAHVALKFMNGRRLRPPDDVEGDGLIGVATETSDFGVKVAALSTSASVGDGCAGPLKASIRLFHPSQASRSA